ncbi:hypothetical protein BDFB_009054 [Asbolus verrucosus]|uniref:Uncharacterized protein n=1 Tax=Asbolus verrucosus TaxID=1661398 RepID=A0A482VZB1_ASBVE|nr:hypothetical protein BDFB_009054 [Asbolus verrucosus]
MDNNYQSEQLEEGEIVDDDDLEAISDNSIIDSTFDSDVSSCRDLKGKLKEAIRISGIEGTHKNTLETRLKGMGGIGNNNKSATSAPEPTPQVDNDSDKIDDNELEKLRIEALKTAVLNKFQRRKKKKALLEEQKEEMKPLGTQENKENDTPKKEHSVVNNSHTEKVETKAPVIDLEEDEDVLRASLLAGLAKKITRVQPTNENSVKTKPVAPKLPVQTASVLPKRPVNHFNNSNNINKNKVVQNRPKPQVKPLIININDDSDSEEESKQKPADPPQKLTDLKVITNSVEKFLKEQRAKFETETKKRFQIVNTVKNKTILEKSAVKLLPKSQQIEYQQLLKRLKNAERKKRAKKIALQKLKLATAQKPPQIIEPTTADQVTIELCPKQTTVEVISTAETAPTPKVEVIVKPVVEVKSSAEDTSKSDSNSASSEQPSKGSDSSERKKGGITNELTTLQKTLKEIKMQKNGRYYYCFMIYPIYLVMKVTIHFLI